MAARHHKADRQRRVGRLFAGGSLDKIGAGHHGDHAGAGDIAQCKQIAGTENHFHMGPAAGLSEGGDFIVKSLPFTAEDVSPRDDDVNIVSPGFDRTANFGDAFGQWREPGGKSSGDCGYPDAAAFERTHRGFNEGVIDADGGDLECRALRFPDA